MFSVSEDIPFIVSTCVMLRVCFFPFWVCAFMSVCAGVHVCIRVCVLLWLSLCADCRFHSSYSIHLAFLDRVSQWPWRCWLGETGWPVSHRDLSVFPSSMLHVQVLTIKPSFLHVSWVSNSGPHARSSPTEPSPWSTRVNCQIWGVGLSSMGFQNDVNRFLGSEEISELPQKAITVLIVF